MPTIDIKQCRQVKKGMRGRDIVAYKRGLSHAGFIEWESAKFTPYAGAFFEKSVKNFQRKNNLPQDGIVGARTHDKLENHFDAYAVKIYKDFCENYDPTTKLRLEIVEAAHYWWSIRDKIVYSQTRPMDLVKPPGYPNPTDCSSFVTQCYYAAGAKDPNGRGFDGAGYTGTLLAHGKKITKSQLSIADLVFYGFTRSPSGAFPYGSPTHVALYAGSGKVYSMGSSIGPSYYDLAYRADLNCYTTCL
jgi:hypothetical protein